jgi:hypothetical protein
MDENDQIRANLNIIRNKNSLPNTFLATGVKAETFALLYVKKISKNKTNK